MVSRDSRGLKLLEHHSIVVSRGSIEVKLLEHHIIMVSRGSREVKLGGSWGWKGFMLVIEILVN